MVLSRTCEHFPKVTALKDNLHLNADTVVCLFLKTDYFIATTHKACGHKTPPSVLEADHTCVNNRVRF